MNKHSENQSGSGRGAGAGYSRGDRVEHFRIQKVIDHIRPRKYVAVDESSGGAVLLQSLANVSPAQLKRIQASVRLVALFEHPGICRVHQVLATDSFVGAVSEVPAGPLLRDSMKEPRSYRESLRLVREVALALQHSHRRGVFHGAIGPDTIAVAKQVQILNLGIAQTTACDERTLAPEVQAGHEPTAQSDVFSLGVMLADLLRARTEGSWGDNESDAWKLIALMISEEPANRPVSMAEVIERIERLVPAVIASQPTSKAAKSGGTSTASMLAQGQPARKRKYKRKADYVNGLISAGKLSEAIKVLTGLTENPQDAKLTEWAYGKLHRTEALVKKLKAGRADVYDGALRLYKRHDYDGAVELVETVPDELHTADISRLYRLCQDRADEVKYLIARIDSTRPDRDYDAISDLERLIELKPRDRYRHRLQKLQNGQGQPRPRRRGKKKKNGGGVLIWVSLALIFAIGGPVIYFLLSNPVLTAADPGADDSSGLPRARDFDGRRPKVDHPEKGKVLFATNDEVIAAPASKKWSLPSLAGPDKSVLWTRASYSVADLHVFCTYKLDCTLLLRSPGRWSDSDTHAEVRVDLSSTGDGAIVIGGQRTKVPQLDLGGGFAEVDVKLNADTVGIYRDGIKLASATIGSTVSPVGYIGLQGGGSLKGIRISSGTRKRSGTMEVCQFDHHDGLVRDSHGTLLVTTTGRSVRVFDWAKAPGDVEVLSLPADSWIVRTAEILPGRQPQLLLITDRSAGIYAIPSGKLARKLTAIPFSRKYMAVSPDGRTLTCSDGNSSGLSDSQKKRSKKKSRESTVTTIDLTKDKVVRTSTELRVQEIAFVTNNDCVFRNPDGRDLEIYNCAGGKVGTARTGSTVTRFATNGRGIIASGDGGDTIRLWDVRGKSLKSLTGTQARVHGFSMDTRGQYLLASGNPTHAESELWDISGGSPSLCHDALPDNIKKATLLSETGYLLCIHTDGLARVWGLNGADGKISRGGSAGSDGLQPGGDRVDYRDRGSQRSWTEQQQQMHEDESRGSSSGNSNVFK